MSKPLLHLGTREDNGCFDTTDNDLKRSGCELGVRGLRRLQNVFGNWSSCPSAESEMVAPGNIVSLTSRPSGKINPHLPPLISMTRSPNPRPKKNPVKPIHMAVARMYIAKRLNLVWRGDEVSRCER